MSRTDQNKLTGDFHVPKLGTDFSDIEETGPLSYDKACIILKQLLDILVTIHDKNIIHRDITPHNIVFEEEGDIRSLRLINFENALYVGGSEEIESHCSSLLRDFSEEFFLHLREKLLNNNKVHEQTSR